MGDLWNMGLQDQEILEGAVGRGFVTEFLGFIELIEQLGDLPVQIIDGKNPSLEDESPSTLFALSSCLANSAENIESLPNIEAWIKEHLPEEYQMVWFKDACRRHGENHLITNGNFVEWARRLEKWVESE
jgi:hypothetical protein